MRPTAPRWCAIFRIGSSAFWPHDAAPQETDRHHRDARLDSDLCPLRDGHRGPRTAACHLVWRVPLLRGRRHALDRADRTDAALDVSRATAVDTLMLRQAQHEVLA